MDRQELEHQLTQAAKQQKVVRITYKDKMDRIATRNVEPYELKNNHLFAYCRKRKGIRQFHLDRIEKAKPTTYSYFAKWPIKLGDELKKEASTLNPWTYRIVSHLFGDYYSAQVE